MSSYIALLGYRFLFPNICFNHLDAFSTWMSTYIRCLRVYLTLSLSKMQLDVSGEINYFVFIISNVFYLFKKKQKQKSNVFSLISLALFNLTYI